MANGYFEYRFYSGLFDRELVRISMYDPRGGEFFATIPAGEGKTYRESRERAAHAVLDAIESGEEPGEVPFA